MKDHYNKLGVVNAYDRAIDRYRVMIDDEPYWFAPFELIPYKAEADPNFTEFANLAQLMEVYDPTFIYADKYMLDDDEILVKIGD